MPRILRPTGMKIYRPFMGPGGKWPSQSGLGSDAYSSAVLGDSPVGYWREVSGATTTDLSGNGWTLTNNSITEGTGPLGLGSAIFNGTSSRQQTATISGTLAGLSMSGQESSIEFMVYHDAADYGRIIGTGPKLAGAGLGGWHVEMTVAGLQRYTAYWGSTSSYWESNSGVTASTWTHVVIVNKEPENTYSQSAIYHNGSSTGITVNGTAGGTSPQTDAGRKFTIGAIEDAGVPPPGTFSTYYSGQLAEIAVYDYILTPTQISAHFAASGL